MITSSIILAPMERINGDEEKVEAGIGQEIYFINNNNNSDKWQWVDSKWYFTGMIWSGSDIF